MGLKAHLDHRPEPHDLKIFQSLLDPLIEISLGPDLPDDPQFEVLVAGRPDHVKLGASKKLKKVVIPFAGLPAETRNVLLEYPTLQVHNLHQNSAATAEMAFALLLAASKMILPMDRSLRNNDWRPRYNPNPALLLDGAQALILGYGAIGKRVAQMCASSGMEVSAIKRDTTAGHLNQSITLYPTSMLHQLLPGTDFLILCLPSTPQTVGMIGEAEIDLLGELAVIVNIARGVIIDEGPLYLALKNKSIFAAGLDVWYNYPADTETRENTPPSRYPFHELENVVLSPHRAGGWQQMEEARLSALAALLNAILQGDKVYNEVDVQAGY
jgi:phosphoglycerate dehydrogenase-like enzyme